MPRRPQDAAPGMGDRLWTLLNDHGRKTLAEEPGCLRFEAFRPLDDSGQAVEGCVVVNELYAGDEALAAHRSNPRIPVFSAALSTMTTGRRALKGAVE